jgi:hypothetical protein
VKKLWISRIEIMEKCVTEGVRVEMVRNENKDKDEGKKSFRY